MNLRFAIYDTDSRRVLAIYRSLRLKRNAGLRHGAEQGNGLKHAGPEAGAPS
jgi:hypothetical protein